MDISYRETGRILVSKKIIPAFSKRPFSKFVSFILLAMSFSMSVKADYTIPVNTTVNAATINTQSGTVHIYGTLQVSTDVTFTSTNPINIILYGPIPGGAIEWTQPKTLAFPAGSTISFVNNPKGLFGTNSAAAILQIGEVKYASANDNSNNVLFSFSQINSIGGTASVTSSALPFCFSDPIQLQASPTVPARQPAIPIRVLWSTTSNNGTFTVNNVSQAVSTTLNNMPLGIDTIICDLYVDGGNNNFFLAARSTIGIDVKTKNTWLGKSTNWNDPLNWCPNIPSSVTDVTIPVIGNNIYPIIGSSTASVRNINIAAGASLVVNGTGVFEIAGVINNSGTLDATAGTLRFNGTGAQTISGSNFLNRTLKNLMVSNPAGLNISSTANDILNVTGALSFSHANATLNTGNNLTLKSSATATANVDVLGPNNNIVGEVLVERYLRNGRKWRLLSAPTNKATQTIRNSWQENGVNTPGFGFNAADNKYTATNTLGFDFRGNNGSVKYWNVATQTFDAVANTNVLPINNEKGYIVFVAGDRNITFPGSNATTLRTKGTLNIGTQIQTTIPAEKFGIVGNPYASRINLKTLTTTGLDNAVYVWDPSLGGSYGLGGFNTFLKDLETGDYQNLLPSPIYGNSFTPNNFIESGAAFMVRAGSDNGSVTFTEAAKTNGSATSSFTSGVPQQLMLNLQLDATTPILLDAAMANFSDNYANTTDENDIRKLETIGESVSWKTDNKDIVIDRRAMPKNSDTLQIIIGKMRLQNYKWEVMMNNMDFPGRQAFLVDRFLQTSTPLDMENSNSISFNIRNIPESYAANRFFILFKQLGALPVNFTNITAQRNNDRSVSVEWKVENEINMEGYLVERSADGTNFESVSSIVAPINNNAGAASYQHADVDKVSSDLFYRIKGLSDNGDIQYSAIVKVGGFKTDGLFTVYPNPVQNKQMNVQFSASVAGNYQITLLGNNGSRVYQQILKLNNNTSTQTIELPANTAAGMYQLQVQTPEGKMEQQAVIVL